MNLSLSLWKYRASFTLLVATLLLLTGCASVQPVTQEDLAAISKHPVQNSSEKGWWQAGFSILFENENEPLWHMDLLLAHSIIAPVLEEYKQDITLWRFHRRAVQDESGHRFSILFYASPETAEKIFNSLQGSELLQKTKTAGLILEDVYDDPDETLKTQINDTSDKNWSMVTQKTWPYYIMGVSQLWLSMIDEIVQENPPQKEITSIEALQEYYKKVNAAVTKIWHEEGNHAFLHHLRGLFGYEPVIVYERRVLHF